MKILCLFAIFAVVSAEFCNRESDCTLTKCNQNFQMECFRDNVCSCIPSRDSYKCSSAADCDTSVIGSCNYNDHKWHCVDSTCHCRWFG